MKFIIGMVSRLEQGKGQDTLIAAVHILQPKFPGIEVLIVGEGDSKTTINLIDLITKYKLQKIIKLTGYVKDVSKMMSKFDVQVFPTRWPLEGFGLVSLEAMLMHIPLVVSNFGPVPEVVGKCAILVDPNPQSLAEGIKKIIKNPEKGKALAEKGYTRVRKLFDIKDVASEYEKLF